MTGLSPTQLDAMRERHRSPFTTREKVARLLWSVVEATLFRMTWPTWYRYRAWWLRRFGADIHPTTRIRRTCRFVCPWNLSMGANTATGDDVWFYCLGSVTIGRRVTVSQFVKLCAGSHDHRDPVGLPLLRPPIRIDDDAWVAADAFVGPGVTIGEGAVLGARGATFKNLEPWTLYGGNPAKALGPRDRQTTDNVSGDS